uniref:Uncharacterized protein n=1 Tax=Caudovirales sp. ctSH72 TaxID=2826773 RepID=A0A8S5QNG7_9CAUD|nr:MAG TPA: hypothetical protein [Caudovirales sp. ctSH72]
MLFTKRFETRIKKLIETHNRGKEKDILKST